eukprot:scaffold14635_cov112-Skeletonema_dohrnii-CCMP3373.AAC.1
MSNNNAVGRSAESLTEELFSCCQFNLLSEEVLRELITRHGLTPNYNLNIRDYEFFLRACANERVTEGILRCLLEYFPAAASFTSTLGNTPLQVACLNKNVTPNIIQLLIDAAPNSIRRVTNRGWMPLHCLCGNSKLDGKTSLEMLNLLIQKCPEAVRHEGNTGDLAIHVAAMKWKTPEFCRVLIEAYPGSERMTGARDVLPLHYACAANTVATVEYLYKLYPDAINRTADGFHPIHIAIRSLCKRRDPESTIEIVEFLLGCDPNVKLQKDQGTVSAASLLHVACKGAYNDSNIDAGILVIKAIYDEHPEAIRDNNIASNIQYFHQQVQTFINSQLVYARQAKNCHQMMTRNRQFPLHRALQNNVSLGSIKLLVKGNPSAIRTVDTNFAMPLHVACQHHNSTKVIQYLVGLDTSTLDAMDRKGDTALHYACRGAKYDTITMLLETYGAVSVSKRNAHKKLPIDLLWDSNAVEDRESVTYTESVFRLLKAYPETMMNYNVDMKQRAKAGGCSPQNEKKRKFCK